MKKYSKGFTLIELLVVIAIIGILSSVVLASLNTARNKGTEAAIKSQLAAMRPQAEIFYDDTTGGNGTYSNLCVNTVVANALKSAYSASGATASTSVYATPGAVGQVTCHASSTAWAIEAPLKESGKFWCVDSTGASLSTTGSTLGANDGACN